MKTPKLLRNLLTPTLLLAALFVPQQLLHAQVTWSGAGADNNWSTPENWAGIAPTDGSTLIFDGTTRLSNTNDLTLAGIAGITFNADGFILNGNSLSLSTSAITNSVGTNIIGLNLTWGTAGNLYAAPNTELVISGVLTNPFTSGSSNVLYKGGGRVRYTGGYLQISNNPATIINNAEVILDGGTFTNGGGVRITSDPGAVASKLILTNGASMSQIIQGGALRIGDTAGTSGQLIMNNSTLTLVSNSINIPFIANGVGSVVQTGGTNTGGVINLNNNSGGVGSYDMVGGVLAAYLIRKNNATGTATMSFDGSVVRALAGGPTAFFTGLNTADIKAGGLTIDSNGETFTLGQIFSGVGRLTKIGAGTVTVNGASTHSGGITANGGTVVLSSTAFTGGLNLSSGTLQLAANLPTGIGTLALNGGTIRSSAAATPRTISGPVTLGGNVTFSTSDLTFSGAHTLSGNRTLTVNNTNTISGTISESGGSRTLTKAGTGILILSAVDNNYSGNTSVTAGTLRVTNPTGSATGSGTTVVTATGIVSGNGQVAAISLSAGGKVAPGTGVGTLIVTNVTFGTAGAYQVEVSDADPNLAVGVGRDFLNIKGTLDITATSASPFVIDVSSMGALAANFDNTQTNSWIIATADNGITGFSSDKFAVVATNFQNSLGANSFSISTSGNNLLLNFGVAATPPSTINNNIVGAGTTSAQLSFSSVSGASYTVQYKTNLNQIGWLDLTNFTATGSTSTAVDNTSPVPAERYYRVVTP
jgi:autotransporter-associated beta strand protein